MVLRGKLPCGAVAVPLITMTKRKAAGEDNKQLGSWFGAVSASNARTNEEVRRAAALNVSAATAVQTNAVYSSQQTAPTSGHWEPPPIFWIHQNSTRGASGRHGHLVLRTWLFSNE